MDELDAGFRVLVDKRDLTSGLPTPTYAAYIPHRPDEEAYLRLITNFFIGPPYLAKSLLRGQLLPAKWVLDFDMRFNYFVPMLEWWVECDHDWAWKPGSLGKGLKAQVPSEVWTAFEATFVGHEESANWGALFAMMKLFGQIAREVAASLGFRYPQDLHDRVVLHVPRMRDGAFASGPLKTGQAH
jgi:aminoglycoside 6-adenylyltransferase